MAEPETRAEGDSASRTTPQAHDATRDSATADNPSETSNAPKPEPRVPKKRISGFVWAALILTLLSAELYAYGHNGEVRVCVGRKGLTDFTQLDKPRNGNVAAGYPFCVESLNLGMYSRSDDVARDALDVACARASALLRGEKSECIRRDKDWIRRVDKKNVPPWDRRFYRRLFFIE